MSNSKTDETSPSPPNEAYWKQLNGSDYREMIHLREHANNRAYQQQEVFLTDLLQREQQRLGRPLDLLEFGCGFGRHAGYISKLPDIRYHGYDFSRNMMQPLRDNPPAGLQPIEERLFSASRLPEAIGERKFDLVFTVSVLIHNAPETLPGLLAELRSALRPGGAVVLVENQLVDFGVWENAWHGGCWLHPYHQLAGAGWDVLIDHGSIDTHDVYILRPNGLEEQRMFRLERGTPRPLPEEELLQLGLERLKSWAKAVAETPTSDGLSQMRISELEERVKVQRSMFERRQRLMALSESLTQLRARPLRQRAPQPGPAAAPRQADRILLDDPLDAGWSQPDARFSRVIHLFPQEWMGIRAAAGYLPGRKLAVAGGDPLTADEHRRALAAAGTAKIVVAHSYSPNLVEVVRMLRLELGTSIRMVAVWHGSTSQFFFEPEFTGLACMLELRARGVLDALGCVKPGMDGISSYVEREFLPNVPPFFAPPDGPRGRLGVQPRPVRLGPPGFRGNILLPIKDVWTKNFYTNLFAACGSPSVREVFVTTSFFRSPEMPLGKRVVELPSPSRREMFQAIAAADVLLNVSLTECHPMSSLESAALGVPCLTGPVYLPPFEDHPYSWLTRVSGPDTLPSVRSALDNLIDEVLRDPSGVEQMIADYRDKLVEEALRRHAEIYHL